MAATAAQRENSMEIPRLAMDGTMRELRKPRQGAFFARAFQMRKRNKPCQFLPT
jgi:hypothetical protein